MYFTRMKLNPGRRGTRFLLASPQRVHAAVLQAFPTREDDDRVLWRIDRPSRHEVALYIVGKGEPDLTHVIEQAGWPTIPEATWQTANYKPFLAGLDVGQEWVFRVRVNPVVRRRDEKKKVHTIPHLTAAQQESWFRDRADSIGVTIGSAGDSGAGLHLTERSSQSFERRTAAPGAGRDVTIASAQIDGVLTVSDPQLLRAALTQGIGRAKAYGCGLMTLALPQS